MGPGSNIFLIWQEVRGAQSQAFQNRFSVLTNTYYFLPEPVGCMPPADMFGWATRGGQRNSICVCFNFKLIIGI